MMKYLLSRKIFFLFQWLQIIWFPHFQIRSIYRTRHCHFPQNVNHSHHTMNRITFLVISFVLALAGISCPRIFILLWLQAHLTRVIIAARQTRAAVLTAQEKDGSQSLTSGHLKGSASIIQLSNTCPGGSSWNTVSKSCDLCKRGTAKFENGPGKCIPCIVGAVASLPGTRACTICPKRYTSYDRINCVIPKEKSESCPRGSGWNTVSKSCDLCKRGTAKFENGPGKCIPCIVGAVASLPGTWACTICPKGSTSYDRINCV